ncbi:MAG: hypothetical protein AB7U41_06975 [Dongiaceae bacterium]
MLRPEITPGRRVSRDINTGHETRTVPQVTSADLLTKSEAQYAIPRAIEFLEKYLAVQKAYEKWWDEIRANPDKSVPRFDDGGFYEQYMVTLRLYNVDFSAFRRESDGWVTRWVMDGRRKYGAGAYGKVIFSTYLESLQTAEYTQKQLDLWKKVDAAEKAGELVTVEQLQGNHYWSSTMAVAGWLGTAIGLSAAAGAVTFFIWGAAAKRSEAWKQRPRLSEPQTR